MVRLIIMTDIQMSINCMMNGNKEKILKGINSDSPILIANAIMQGVNFEIKDKQFTESLKKLKTNNIRVLNVPLNYLAIAALSIIGDEVYTGDDVYIKNMIESKFGLK